MTAASSNSSSGSQVGAGSQAGGQSMVSSHLVCLFCVTAGQNGENLGSDEEQIVLLVYLLYDLTNNKVVTLQEHYVRPIASEDVLSATDAVLTEECRIQTGLSEQRIKNAQPLDVIIDELERFLCAKEIHPDHGGRPFYFCTDGQLHLRMCLHPEASGKNILLPSHYHRFFDLRKEFRKFYKTERPLNCLKDMLDFLGLENDQSMEYGVRHCQEMSTVIHRLVNDGHVFSDYELIHEKLEPGVCSSDDVVDDETVIRARGLPWQSSDQDIARFFKGLNLARGGVALCLSQQGRRNGEALVRLESREHRDLALRKHKHHIGQRYIEVYRATGEDFLAVAGGSNTEAQEFLSRRGSSGQQVIVRMRGLPYTCKAEQVMEFFREGPAPVEVLDGEEGILFVHQADGRSTGDCFVLFPEEEEAALALAKHRQCIGSRYIELFKSTTAEVQQVLNRSMDPRNTMEDILQGFAPAGAIFAPLHAGGLAALPTLVVPHHQFLITSGTQRDCVRLRGLPLETTVSDILSFLGEHSKHIVLQGVHQVYNSMGLPSGEAFIQMDSELSAEAAYLSKHQRTIYVGNKKGKVDVIQCSGQDMNLVLTAGLPPTPIPALPSSSPYLLTAGTGPYHHTVLPQLQNASGTGHYAAILSQLQNTAAPGQYATILPQLPNSAGAGQYAAILPQMQNTAGMSQYPAVLPALPSTVGEGPIPGFPSTLTPPGPRSVLPSSSSDHHQQLQGIISVSSKMSTTVLPSIPSYGTYSGSNYIIQAPAAVTTLTTANTAAAGPQLLSYHTMFTPRPTVIPAASAAGSQLLPVSLPAAATYPAAYHLGQQLPPQQPTYYISNAHMGPTSIINGAHMGPNTLINGAGVGPMSDPVNSAGYPNYQSILYWYPSPPVSPQKNGGAVTYIQPYGGAAAVSIKGLPPNVQAQDILNFLSGLYEIVPDVQILRTEEGHPTGEAIVTFHSRAEAEKVLRETNRRLLGNQSLNVCIC